MMQYTTEKYMSTSATSGSQRLLSACPAHSGRVVDLRPDRCRRPSLRSPPASGRPPPSPPHDSPPPSPQDTAAYICERHPHRLLRPRLSSWFKQSAVRCWPRGSPMTTRKSGGWPSCARPRRARAPRPLRRSPHGTRARQRPRRRGLPRGGSARRELATRRPPAWRCGSLRRSPSASASPTPKSNGRRAPKFVALPPPSDGGAPSLR